MTRKKLGKLLAVIEDPRNFGQMIEMFQRHHPLQLSFVEFNWQYTSQISQYDDNSNKLPNRLSRFNRYDLYVKEYLRAQRSWKQHTESDALWSNVRYITLYIFEHYDVVISYRNLPVHTIVTWYNDNNRHGIYETLTSHQALLRLFKEMKQGYLP